ncbi:unnamed protein product [Microthlaspi erraticum]|uniref:Uncharacterized protein n=1 Tax=Microthlaspi erraticum TaxID=1685480 RepID=A0A6D2ID56_9BRAS|nr:unnamed protein product [Microthlaspi erraticum]
MEHLVLDKVDHTQLDLKVVVLHRWWPNPLSLLMAVWSISETNWSRLTSSTGSITQRVSIPLWYIHGISNKHLRFLLYPLSPLTSLSTCGEV